MKRINYSSLILFLFILSSNAFAQAPNFSTSSQTVCYNSAPGTVTVGIFITVALILALELLDQTLRNPYHAEKEIGYEGDYHYCYCTKSSHFRYVLEEVLKNGVHLENS